MTFECSACHMRYRIDDSIVPRGGARVRCRQCSTLILIPAQAVVPPPANLDLIPPAEPPRPRPAAPPAPPTPSEWQAIDPRGEAIAPARPEPPAPPAFPAFLDPPVTAPSEPVGGMAVVGESQGVDALGVERFAPPTPPPAGERDPAFEDIGMSVSRFEAGPVKPSASERQPAAPDVPRLETESLASPMRATAPVPTTPPFEVAQATAPAQAPRPATPPPSLSTPADVGAGASNVVPLTHGTPIPGGLSPEERTRHEKARRLARVLASDIAIYNREKKDRGMQEGNLVAVLGYEIKKSWETSKERVGTEFANSTPYFRDALNDLLAEGKKVF